MAAFSPASDRSDAVRSFLNKPSRTAAVSSKVMAPASEGVKTPLRSDVLFEHIPSFVNSRHVCLEVGGLN